jgi:hypothetical protein
MEQSTRFFVSWSGRKIYRCRTGAYRTGQLPPLAAIRFVDQICRGNGSPVAASKKLDQDGAPRASAKQGKSKDKSPAGKNPAVGEALRSIYQRTIDESVPQEMIDLLGKLG